MTIYVDDMRLPARVGRLSDRWSHLFADTDAELHRLAASIGLRRSWFQDEWGLPHYDVTDSKRCQAIAAGAVPVSWRDTGRWVAARLTGPGTGAGGPDLTAIAESNGGSDSTQPEREAGAGS